MKPYIASSCLILVVASAALWFATPGVAHAVPLALVAFAIATVAAEVAAVFNNAMMARLAGPAGLGRLSGTGWAVGYAGGLVSLILMLGFMAASPETGKTFFGLTPWFGLDPATREGDRASGPLAAMWLLAFVWPLFVFTPDAKSTGKAVRDAVRDGLLRLRSTIGEARHHPEIGRFLLGNMIYQDGLVALFSFGGIYGAGVFGWSPTELGIFGILLTVSGTAGALVGGVLDDRIGARPVILGSLAVLVFVCLGILSLGREHILFVIPTVPASEAIGLFGGVPEKVFLGLGLLIGAVAGPLQASSRAYLARTVPPEDAGRYFGLLALSGKVTSVLAPLAVAVATQMTGTQAAGPAVLILFFGAGAALLASVRRA
jgi:UMF1 family MFS transporter